MVIFKKRNDTFDEGIIDEVYNNNSYRLKELKDIVVLDIGAQIGSFSVTALEKGASKVYSFEPEKNNFVLANENLANFENCKVYNVAVSRSDKDSIMLIDESDNSKNTGGFSTVTDYGTQVKTVKLDSLIDELSPNLIKLDIEGAEYPVLYTCSKLDTVDFIIGEYHEFIGTKTSGIFSLDENTPNFLKDFKGKLNIENLAKFLEEKGYVVIIERHVEGMGFFWALRNKDTQILNL